MKHSFVFCALAAVALLFLSGCGTMKTNPEEEARQARLMEQRLDARSYKVDFDTMYPLRGPRQILTTPYAVIIHDDQIDSHLPYRGEAWNVPYGGGKVLTFKDDIRTYRDYPQGDRRVVDLVVDNEEDILEYHFEFFANGKATLHIKARNRQSIDYSGRVNAEYDPAKPKE